MLRLQDTAGRLAAVAAEGSNRDCGAKAASASCKFILKGSIYGLQSRKQCQNLVGWVCTPEEDSKALDTSFPPPKLGK
eukprot:1133671-Pelagomonas_calceolata.AAC.10